MEVYVFKTDVNSKKAVKQLSDSLDLITLNLGKWNFDLEDCDKILRIESKENISKQTIALLNSNGHKCDELF
jgi:hypothetical protein